jgi:hypothetical protein
MQAVASAPPPSSTKWTKYRPAYLTLVDTKGYPQAEAVRFIADHQKLSHTETKRLQMAAKSWERTRKQRKAAAPLA